MSKLFKVKIVEVREKTYYCERDFDFEAESWAENQYTDGKINLEEDYVTDVKYYAEEID